MDVIDYLRGADHLLFSNEVFDLPHVVAFVAEWIRQPEFHRSFDDGVMGRGMKRYRP